MGTPMDGALSLKLMVIYWFLLLHSDNTETGCFPLKLGLMI
jgi:hypothetical protein